MTVNTLHHSGVPSYDFQRPVRSNLFYVVLRTDASPVMKNDERQIKKPMFRILLFSFLLFSLPRWPPDRLLYQKVLLLHASSLNLQRRPPLLSFFV